MNALVRDLFVAFLFTACASARAATILAPSLSLADVQAALNQAQAGDTVVLPAGSANWTTGVSWSVPANVTVMGAGTSATGGGDQTVITDNYASGQPLLKIAISSTGVFRLTGITVRSGSGSIKDNGTISIAGPGTLRIDHCHFNSSSSANYQMVAFWNGLFGVMDHCVLDLLNTNALYFYNGRHGSGDAVGNLEWTLPTNFGGADYFYVEDNIINGYTNFGVYSTRIFDGTSAAKVVVRFNTVSQAVLGETHATGHAGNDRGLRSQEIYGNAVSSSLSADPSFCAIDMSSGTALVWGNTWNQVYKNIYRFNVTRKDNATYSQTATPNGWGYAGTAFNGTGSNWDGGTALGTDTTLGYPCLDQPGRGQGDLITGDHPNKVNSTTGTLRWPNQALEPIYIWNNSGAVVPGWGDKTVSDATGGRAVANRDYYLPASGVQTSPTSPFNGTSGTGWGTLANRPTTATPGVAYWATDQGSWNTSSSNPYGVQRNGEDGVLYKCTAPNVWTVYYTPYTYPHPLQGESPNPTPTPSPSPIPTPTPLPNPSPSPNPPTNLKVQSSTPPTQLRTYSTSFSLTENPINEGNIWINGGKDGLKWTNVRTVSGIAFGTQSGSGGYDDSTAIVSGPWAADQSCEATIHTINQQNTNIIEEVELRLRTTISSNSITGYEILFKCTSVSDPGRYVQIVRWNGPLGSFDYIDARPGPGINNGDKVKATIVGSTITAYVNGVQVAQGTDSTFKSGSPGIGFFLRETANSSDFGFTDFTASEIQP